MFSKTLTCATVMAGTLIAANSAMAEQVKVTISNNAATGGVYLTPVWVGFHDGSFDSYDGGSATSPELARLAEDGNTEPISMAFAADGTRVQGALANGGPIAPGTTVMGTFDIDASSANQYFSYASMVLPSNDYFVANGNPLAHDLSSLVGAAAGTSISFNIMSVNDAGTEVNDFDTSAGNGLFPQLNLPAGQGAPDTGVDENGVAVNITTSPFTGFLNAPADLGTNPDAALIDFTRTDLYPNGIATVTIEVIPEPTMASLLAIGATGLVARRRRKA